MSLCINCERSPAVRRSGECSACYRYRIRHDGTPRPARLYERVSRHSRYCERCGRQGVVAGGRCSTCYKWTRYKGRERPRHLFDPNCRCRNRNCDKPLGGISVSGLCDRCRLYWSLTGEHMPKRFMTVERYCECGEPAIEEALVLGERYWLCKTCLEDAA